MEQADYFDLVETLYANLEARLDVLIEQEQKPLDYEHQSGVMTIICEPSQSAVIVTKQQAVQQVWVAARQGGYHFNYVDGQWRCTKTQISLPELLEQACSEQAGVRVHFGSL